MAKKKVKKPSYRKLAKLYKELETNYKLQSNLLYTLQQEGCNLRKKLNERVDTTMMAERIKLANAIGQLMATSCDAVKYIIGKEVL